MKLIFCPACQDVFKLNYELRSCECGRCCGQYDVDGHHAVTNGKGYCLAIGNGSLRNAIFGLAQFDYTASDSRGKLTTFLAWVRPHEGPENPRSRINPNLRREGGTRQFGEREV